MLSDEAKRAEYDRFGGSQQQQQQYQGGYGTGGPNKVVGWGGGDNKERKSYYCPLKCGRTVLKADFSFPFNRLEPKSFHLSH